MNDEVVSESSNEDWTQTRNYEMDNKIVLIDEGH